MGHRLVEFFDRIKKEGGLRAQMRLAMKTGYSSAKAEQLQDTQELIQKFQNAFREIVDQNTN